MCAQRPADINALTDKDWQLLEPMLSRAKPGGRPRKYPMRGVMNAIEDVLRAGCAWRLMPHDRPQWQTADQTCRAWRQDGTWRRIHDQLRDAVRTRMGRHHRCPNGQHHRNRGAHDDDGAKQLNGRKRHLLVDTPGLRWRVLVHPADLRDAEMAPWLLAAAYEDGWVPPPPGRPAEEVTGGLRHGQTQPPLPPTSGGEAHREGRA